MQKPNISRQKISMISKKLSHLRIDCRKFQRFASRTTSSTSSSLRDTLELVKEGKLQPSEAESLIKNKSNDHISKTPEETLKIFANLDHSRSRRTGFPEAVFAAGKTPFQVATILDDFALNLNMQIQDSKEDFANSSQRAVLATRVTQEQYEEVKNFEFKHGSIEYNQMARIITMNASGFESLPEDNKAKKLPRRIIVATAGTTDINVAEEAAITLEAANCDVERIYDVGVAGLHRVINALPKLQNPDVGCVIVCAGMDGALPSVVGGMFIVYCIDKHAFFVFQHLNRDILRIRSCQCTGDFSSN
jgi:hypothetical protein